MAGKKLVDPRDQNEHRRVELDTDDEDTLRDDELDEDENVDAKPATHPENAIPPVEEQGLSIAPEDMGKQWLGSATEQGNYESSMEPEEPGMHITKTI